MSENIVICPHCNLFIEILELNCKIFRHGIYKNNNQQIPPHAKKDECDYLFTNNLIYGCGKPFKIEIIDNKFIAINCEYI